MGYKKIILILVVFILSYGSTSEIQSNHFPIPDTVSTEIKPLLSSDFPDYWNDHPQNASDWNRWVNTIAEGAKTNVETLIEKTGVNIESIVVDGVNIFVITPNEIALKNQTKALLHFHGGGYVLNPGIAGLDEAILMANSEKIRIYSVDYKMPPEHPFPRAIDDAVIAYQHLLTLFEPNNIGVFGTSTGGGITFSLMLEAKRLKLPFPAALMVGTPWTDLSKTGDSYFTHESIDNVLVSYDGWLGSAAKLYANGHDLKEPLLSPIYGDVMGFPPTILFTGTRDLFLSNTTRMHLKLKDSGVIADLIVFEGLSHAQYLFLPDSPESKRYFQESAKFFHQFSK